MLEYPRDPNLPPGTWNLWTTGKRRVLFSCPKCGDTGLLDHAVASDGSVTPSVQCTKPGCGFHENIRLSGWDSEPLELPSAG